MINEGDSNSPEQTEHNPVDTDPVQSYRFLGRRNCPQAQCS